MATIRLMTPADYEAVTLLSRDAVSKALVGRPIWDTVESIANAVLELDQAAFIVAVTDEGEVVGLAGYHLLGNGEASLYGPIVSTEGHGIGAWLLGRVEAMASQEGATVFAMLVGVDNQAGAAWAEWNGYVRDTETPNIQIPGLFPVAKWLKR
jgi:predicted N-acetyltransferase YhbS